MSEDCADRAVPVVVPSVRRLGLILVGFQKATVPALKYLLLQLNHLQKAFECEILPSVDDVFLTNLKSRVEVRRATVREHIPEFCERYQNFLDAKVREFKLIEQPPDYFIVLSLANFDDGYYTTRQGPGSVIALGNWKRHMAPPTEVEFLLTLVIREAVSAMAPSLRGSIHLGTKGCICDFTDDLEDVRYKVLSGFVCSFCRAALERDHLPRLATDIEAILSKRWLGKSNNNPAAPAAIISKLGHNLFTTKGLQPTKIERFISAAQDEGAKTIVKAVGVVLVALLGLGAGTMGFVEIGKWLNTHSIESTKHK